ncbi:MAG: aminotransferase class III-fold pyridoxal phosphate-dependent enzyme [Candidatus Gracilibacteria bacterium]|jgi:acetylornithine/succinyldiaminopimelate/putrescine aminotransferase
MKSLAKLSAEYLIDTYSQWPLTILRGKGSYVWDDAGKKYLDFYGGHAVALLGHCPPRVVKAIQTQSSKLIFYSNLVITEPQVRLAEKLCKTLSPASYQAYFCNHGAEANETALKIARKVTGKQNIIAFTDSFHGRSTAALSATGIASYHNSHPNLLAYTKFAQLGDIASVEKVLDADTAAVIIEPIQSIGGMQQTSADFYQKLASLCKDKGVLLIFDEVQTGVGRCGSWWFAQQVKVTPDLITTAKGLAGGLPIGAVLVEKATAGKIQTGDIATTFGGGAVVAAAALATLETIAKEKLLQHVKKERVAFDKAIIQLPGVVKTRGAGFLIGIEFEQPIVKELIGKLRAVGILSGNSTNPKVMRIFPPLTASKAEFKFFLDKLKLILNSQK